MAGYCGFRARWQPVREPHLSAAGQKLLDGSTDEQESHCWDDAKMEIFLKTPKVERTNLLRYDTRAGHAHIVDWIEGFYNHRRMHSSIGYKLPVDIESALMAA